MWIFLACPAPGGGRPIDRFVSELEDESVNEFAAVLEGLQCLERHQWKRPQFDLLNDGIGEIRFNGDDKTYRVFGYFGPRRKHFTMLIACAKKSSLKEEMKQAVQRKKFAEQSEGLLYEFTFE